MELRTLVIGVEIRCVSFSSTHLPGSVDKDLRCKMSEEEGVFVHTLWQTLDRSVNVFALKVR